MRKQNERTDKDSLEKTRTEEEPRQSEERDRTTIMSAGGGAIATDTAGGWNC
jgi:hypothetical protein